MPSSSTFPSQPPGHVLGSLVTRAPRSDRYEAERTADGTRVLLETPRGRADYRTFVDAFGREQAILAGLSDPVVLPVLSRLGVGGRPWLTREHPAGRWVSDLGPLPLDIEEVLVVAIALTRAVAVVHRLGVLHHGLHPSHAVIAPGGAVRLTGFGRASDRAHPPCVGLHASDPAYLAPEQTGRMKQLPDARADLYALGVIVYELATGRLPLQATDAPGWVLAHLARIPPSPAEVHPSVPRSLDRILNRLLTKDPSGRYQTAIGLERDLERALLALRRGDDGDFSLGTEDVHPEFQVSRRLHGREQEVAALLAAFDRAVEGDAAVLSLVPGYSGIGKTSIVGELYQPAARRRGRFIQGKFDQYKRDIPYATVAQAFGELVRELLSESETELSTWRARLSDALGDNQGVLSALVPELSILLGPAPPVPVIGPREAQDRFDNVLLAFLQAVASTDHPLVMFLDDMQWADGATLHALRALAAPGAVPGLHLVLAYRDNEVDDHHPFAATIEQLKADGVAVETVPVRELDDEHLAALVGDTVRRPADDPEVRKLAGMLARKAGGNPFFVGALLTELHRRDLLTFDDDRRRWVWDTRAADAVDVAGSVVDLLVGRLNDLPEEQRRLLALSACFGNQFDVEGLAALLERSVETVRGLLHTAHAEELVVPDAASPGRFRFHHDRIHQAAASLWNEAQRREGHLAIGRLWRQRVEGGADDLLFEAAEYLNQATSLMEADERLASCGST